MYVPWYAYAEAVLIGFGAAFTVDGANSIPFGLGRRLRYLATIVDHAAVACLLNLAMLDLVGWLLR